MSVDATAERKVARGARRSPRHHSTGKIGAYLLLSALALFALIPFSWLMLAAFDGDASISVEVPRVWTLTNFTNLFANEDGVRLMANSLIYAGGATTILVVVTTLAGYALSRYDFRGRRVLMLGILLTRVIPPTATIAPLYV
ncbi:MAG: carbohydrate ABC transporter permease, partial [Actinomycetota bacterium]|nr:carbohydrate ABC transporter permease [Actinomycetota bacterium]